MHVKSRFLHAHLDKELREKYKKRSFRVITGDKIKVMRGQFRGKEGKVERVDLKKGRVYVTKVEKEKIDGSRMLYPLQPSNLLITELKLDDKKRVARLKRGRK